MEYLNAGFYCKIGAVDCALFLPLYALKEQIRTLVAKWSMSRICALLVLLGLKYLDQKMAGKASVWQMELSIALQLILGG